jgi:hypothetical protein
MILWQGKQWTRQELLAAVGHPDQIAGIDALEFADGRERGTRAFQVYTGSGLRYTVLADRALDITACTHNGASLAWHAPVGNVHPAYYEPHGIGWLRSFAGGLLTTCGLDQFGAPSSHGGEEYGLHGRISSTPAEQVAYRTYWSGDDYLLEISGEMRQARLFGENLVLRRRILSRLGSDIIEVHDTVTNEGFAPQPHMILYHCNLGFPLISPQSLLRIPASHTHPRDVVAQAGADTWSQFDAPTAGYAEQVFRHETIAHDGWVQVEVENPLLSLKLQIAYPLQALPHLFQWKMMGQGAYVLGIEPANSSAIQGRAAAHSSGDLPVLQPGESAAYQLRFTVSRE